jgi:hypothetical protein
VRRALRALCSSCVVLFVRRALRGRRAFVI